MQRIPPFPEEVHDDPPRNCSVHLEDFWVGRTRFRVRVTWRERETIGSDGGSDRSGCRRECWRSRSREERSDDTRHDVENNLEENERKPEVNWFVQLRDFSGGRFLTCSLTAFLSPKTVQPPISPAKKVSSDLCFPPASVFCNKRHVL